MSRVGRGALAVVAIGVLQGAQASAATVANFTDGNGTASSDQWTGIAGNGWATGWASLGAAAGTGVVSTSPLEGGGNYLQFVDDTTTAAVFARRQLVNFGEVNLAQPYRLSLSYRFDGDIAQFTQFADRIGIYGDSSATGGTGATNTWSIGVVGGNTGAGGGQSAIPGHWYFIDNNGSNAFATTNMFDTGLSLVSGRVYSITVDVNPVAGTYGASINDGVNAPVSASGLTFRNGATGTSASWLHINMSATAATDNSAFSVDNISVVPEPGALGFLLVGAGLLGSRRRRVVG